MVRTQVQLTEKQLAFLHRNSSSQGVSISEQIRRGVDMLMRESLRGPSKDCRKKKAIALIGKYKSKTGDLSMRHDKHLAEIF